MFEKEIAFVQFFPPTIIFQYIYPLVQIFNLSASFYRKTPLAAALLRICFYGSLGWASWTLIWNPLKRWFKNRWKKTCLQLIHLKHTSNLMVKKWSALHEAYNNPKNIPIQTGFCSTSHFWFGLFNIFATLKTKNNERKSSFFIMTSRLGSVFRIESLGIQSPCQMMLGVYNHLLSKVFRFHYHSQKVIGSLGNTKIETCNLQGGPKNQL